MTGTAALRWAGFVVLLGLALWAVVSRLALTYDLGFFLPRPITDGQRVLVERMGQGPGSSMLFVVLPGASAAERDALGESLRAVPGVAGVLPRDWQSSLDLLPPTVFANRYLLGDVDASTAGLKDAFTDRLRDLASFDAPEFLELVAADPHLAALSILESLGASTADSDFVLDDETPYLLVQTAGSAFDPAAQRQVIGAVADAVAAAGAKAGAKAGANRAPEAGAAPSAAEEGEAGRATGGSAAAELYGAGVYGMRLQAEVERESTLFTSLAAAGLALLLLVAYRSGWAVLLAGLPLVTGAVAGAAALALLFPQVHGITLAFGFTLMGVTVDYALHVLSHTRGVGRAGMQRVGPTLLLSVLSSALAFLAFTASGSRGLVQLGVFSAVGIGAAALTAWLLLPDLAARLRRPGAVDEPAEPASADRQIPTGTAVSVPPVRFRLLPLILASVAGIALLATRPALFDDDLSSLTPVPAEVLAVDRQLRTDANAPDIRHLVVSRGADQIEALRRAQAVARLLDGQIAAGALGGRRSVTDLLPTPELQQARRESLGADTLPARVAAALEGLPFQPEAFQPFVDAVQRTAASGATVSAATWQGTPLEGLVSAMLYADEHGWVAVTYLQGLENPEALGRALAAIPGSDLVDLRGAAESLLATYRGRLLEILAGALLLVAVTLGLVLRAPRRTLWIVGTVAGSLLLSVGIIVSVFGSLSIFELVAATLVAGLGLDYALFFSSPQHSAAGHRDTRHALTVCFASTLLVFGLLSLSGIPVLHGIGITVAVGVAVAYLLALTGRYLSPAT